MKSLIVVLLLGFYTSTLIYESMSKTHYKELFKKEIIAIHELNSMQSFVFPIHSEDIENKKIITIEDIKPFLAVINPDMMTFEVSPTNEVKFTFTKNDGDISCFIMSLHCEFTDVEGSKTSAKFSIITNDYSFTKTHQLFPASDYYVPIGKAEITFGISNVSVAKENIITKEALAVHLQKYLAKISADLLAAYTKGITDYYTNKGRVPKGLIYVSKGIAVAENTIKLSQDKAPVFKENVVIHHYNGNINELTDPGDLFEKDSKSHFIAVNMKVVQSLIDQNLFEFKMEENQKPIQDYSLTIKSAAEICDELKSEPLTKVLVVKQKIERVTLDSNNFSAAKALLLTKLVSFDDDKVLLSFNTEFAIKLVGTSFQKGFNLRLKSNEMQITSVKVTSDPVRTITNDALLKKWILTSFQVYLFNNEYNLLDLSFDLSEYFPEFESVSVEKNYLILQ